MNRVKLGFFSMSGGHPEGADGDYLRWHQLDHMPEQYQLPGIVQGQRWACTPACLARRAATSDLLGPVRHVVQYLMGDPVPQTLEDFFELGQRLAALGRMADRLPSRQLVGASFLEAHAAPEALVLPEVLPFRPNRGIYLAVASVTDPARLDEHARALHTDHVGDLLAVDGVAGVWLFGSTPDHQHPRFAPGRFRVAVCYLDEEPSEVAGPLGERWRRIWDGAPVEPLLATAFESMVPWAWDRFDHLARPLA